MRVKEIVLDGFKSYAKRTVIANWDAQFNCITGLNGSGKSNILDAICFVLGITSMPTVRAQNQQDLIYKRGQAGVTKASVSIVFDNSDTSKSPLGYKECQTITVTRQVVLGGTSKYLINGHRAQQNVVQQMFQEIQLNVNNPNFLIMQGQITKVVNMRPTEILGLIEEAAGTGIYKKERQRATKDIESLDPQLHESVTMLNEEVRPQLENKRSQKREYLEFQRCATTVESLERVVAGSQYREQQHRLDSLTATAEQAQLAVEELRSHLVAGEEKLQELEQQYNELKASNKQSEEAIRLDAELQSAQEDQARLTTKLELKQQQLSDTTQRLVSNTQTEQQLKQQLTDHEHSVGAFETEHTQLKQQLEKQHAYIEDRRELLSGLQTGISTTGDRETGYAYATKKAREHVAAATERVDSLKKQQQQLEQQVHSSSTQAATNGNESIEMLTAQADQCRHRLEELQTTRQKRATGMNAIESNATKARSLKRQLQECRDSHEATNRDLERMIANNPNLDNPSQIRSPKIRGRVAQLFKIHDEHKNKAQALQTVAGGSLWSVVVDDESIGSEVLKGAKRRTNVIPLNKIQSFTIDKSEAEKIDPRGAWRAIDLLGYDEDVAPAIKFVFGSTIICATDKIAERAAFQFKRRAVTLEGDFYDPRGVLSGGYTNKQKNGTSVFTMIDKYHELIQKKLDAERQEQETSTELESLGSAVVQAEQVRNEMALAAHEEDLARARLTETEAKLDAMHGIELKLAELTNSDLPQALKDLAESQNQLKHALAEASEFSNNREGKLKELVADLDRAKQQEQKLNKTLEQRNAQHSENEAQLIRLNTDLQREREERVQLERTRQETRREIEEMQQSTLLAVQRKINELTLLLRKENARAADLRSELKETETELNNLQTQLGETRLEIQQHVHAEYRLGQTLKAAQATVASIEKRWNWAAEVAEELANEGLLETGPTLEQSTATLAQEQRRMQTLESRVDTGVVSMIERLESDEDKLRLHIRTTRSDRSKLVESMEIMDMRRRTTINEVWRQVSDDFGQIFGDLLPNAFCQLVPINDDPVEHGFIIRVRLGSTWKDGLTELSGGQRSLVALSLILALLRYHPAPMYILDEVDAALDVHHTRNIGHIIKTRFQNSQFIVVSLKDDMFTNANRIFQTKFVEGTSTVNIMA